MARANKEGGVGRRRGDGWTTSRRSGRGKVGADDGR